MPNLHTPVLNCALHALKKGMPRKLAVPFLASSPRRLFFWFEGATALLGGGCAFLAASFLLPSTPPLFVVMYWNATNSVLTLSASIAAALTGLKLWRYCVARVHWLSIRRAIGVGMLFSILAHPLAWFLAMIFSSIASLLDPAGPLSTLGMDPFTALFGAFFTVLFGGLFLSACSLLLVGWLTLIVSAPLAGGLLLLLRHQNSTFQPTQRGK